MIEVARSHALEQQLEIDYRVLEVDRLAAAEPATFDVIACMEMLEHVPEPAAIFGAFARLAKPGGHLFVSTINRNLKSFALAIVGAEYLLRLLPRGTHEYERLIRPAELARWARTAGFELRELAGLAFNPLSEECRLTRDVSVNYLAHFVRSAR
jgi:2-polyprenyl-6-hydroxyphenyl methylase/3-demethylubiquinone-9 3-methyltransferase